VETILSIILFGIIGILLSQVILTGARFYESFTSKQEIHDQMFLAQRRFNTDVANVKDIQNFLYADNIRLQFIDSNNNTIQYRYGGGMLYRTLNNDGEFPLAINLTDETGFYYYDRDENILSGIPVNLKSIWSVSLKLQGSKGTENMTFWSLKSPQNFKYGINK